MKAKATVAALLLSLSAFASAQEKSPFTFALHGFISTSACYDTNSVSFSSCQQSLFANPELATDSNALTFDVRQSRFNFSVTGPQVLYGATPKAVLELDFFQGYGNGAYGDVSLLNRMRLAYSELDWGANKLAFGQMNDLIFAMAPVSLSHIAFPLGYETGNLGWRRPAIWGFHTFKSGDLKFGFDWEIGRSQWIDNSGTGIGGNTPGNLPTEGGFNQGEASSTPAFEARLSVAAGKLWSAWVAGHYNKVDLNGAGTSGGNSLTVDAVAAGAKLSIAPLTVAATGFFGKNTGPLIANLVQFNLGPNDADVSNWGYWAQAGFNFTPELSLWALFGQQKPNQDDAKAAGMTRLENQTFNLLAMYRSGGYGFSAEWINFKTTYAAYAGGAFTGSTDQKANQVILTANYFY